MTEGELKEVIGVLESARDLANESLRRKQKALADIQGMLLVSRESLRIIEEGYANTLSNLNKTIAQARHILAKLQAGEISDDADAADFWKNGGEAPY